MNISPDSLSIMTTSVLNQAKDWGFVCERDQTGNWHIFAPQNTARWKLRLVGDRFLLIVGSVPQVNLHPPEAIAFLERRRSSQKKLELAKTFR